MASRTYPSARTSRGRPPPTVIATRRPAAHREPRACPAPQNSPPAVPTPAPRQTPTPNRVPTKKLSRLTFSTPYPQSPATNQMPSQHTPLYSYPSNPTTINSTSTHSKQKPKKQKPLQPPTTLTPQHRGCEWSASKPLRQPLWQAKGLRTACSQPCSQPDRPDFAELHLQFALSPGFTPGKRELSRRALR